MDKTLVDLADDDFDDRELFVDALSELPLSTEILQFSNGIELMDCLFTNKTLPHIIFLDLFMPYMDGFDCLLDIRNFTKFKNIKIVVYSSVFQEREVRQLREDGANGYIQKPNSYIVLKNLIYKAIHSLSSQPNESSHFEILI